MTGDIVIAQMGGSFINALFVFVVSLLIGAVGIYTGARLLIDRDTGFRRAIVTAFVGAIIWALVAFFVGWIPIIGPLLTLIVWIGFINWQYPGGWGTAVGIGFVAWIVTFAILYVLSLLGFVGLGAIGVP
ncbi:hypothetical protein [Halocatena marina]|uniref:Uncharacterized protein n=1 Tax=Halocatena marina TaxID=2934937 RepID=A0ABD5YUD6_9EURY|nr:hypothetical protein [Halocatena marina]